MKLSTPLRTLTILALCLLIIPLVIAVTHSGAGGVMLACFAPMALLRTEAKDEGDQGGGGDVPKDPKEAVAAAKQALENTSLTFTQRLGAGMKILAGIQFPEQVANIQALLNTANET